MSFRRRFATLIRRFPRLMLIPYYMFRTIQPKYSVGVVGVVFNESDEVLLVEHVFHPIHPWGLPGGWVGFNESPAEAVIREIHEELKLGTEACYLLLTERTKFNHLDIAYLCEPTGSVGDLSYELLNYRWHKPDTLPQLQPFHLKAIEHAFHRLNKENHNVQVQPPTP